MEIWKPMRRFENDYEISNIGVVRQKFEPYVIFGIIRKKKPEVLKTFKLVDGTLMVKINIHGIEFAQCVASLVYTHFCINDEELIAIDPRQIGYKDNDKNNVSWENLYKK